MKRTKYKALRLISLILVCLFASKTLSIGVVAENTNHTELDLDCKSAILMEAQTGKILYADNENEALPPASVTKVMTLLLIMEAIEDKQIALTDMVSASDHACSMGGSQIFLEPGEQMSVEDLLKSVVIASANDAAVTLAEYVAGTEDAFVEMMNARATELGMENTVFENTNGLDDTTENHVTSANDIAIMSRELIKHEKITEYSSIWMDTIRNGEFGLTNTNRLVRFYKGATGLKTGSTSKAGFCITATAKRDGMTLIAVIMASPSRDARNNSAVALLNYGFSNFTLYKSTEDSCQQISVVKGKTDVCRVEETDFYTVIDKKSINKIQKSVEINENVIAPITQGQQIGSVKYSLNGDVLGTTKIIAVEAIEKIGFFDVCIRFLAKMTLK